MDIVIAVLLGRQASTINIDILEAHAVHIQDVDVPGIYAGDRSAGLQVIITYPIEFIRKTDVLVGR